jgi:hypothetical protein
VANDGPDRPSYDPDGFPTGSHEPVSPAAANLVSPGYGSPDWHPPADAFYPPPSGRRIRTRPTWLPWAVGGAVGVLLLGVGTFAIVAAMPDENPAVSTPPVVAPSTRPAASPSATPSESASPSASASPSPSATTSSAAPSPTVPSTPATTSAAPKVLANGTWLVPADMPRRTYHTTVPASSPGCYWERSKSADLGASSIIANDRLDAGAHAIVTISTPDQAFKSDDCGTWVVAPKAGKKAKSFGSGVWAVGIDIAVGTYTVTVPGSSSGCYWARTKNFLGELDSIISNDSIDAGDKATVTVKSTDKGFQSKDCGTWTRR